MYHDDMQRGYNNSNGNKTQSSNCKTSPHFAHRQGVIEAKHWITSGLKENLRPQPTYPIGSFKRSEWMRGFTETVVAYEDLLMEREQDKDSSGAFKSIIAPFLVFICLIAGVVLFVAGFLSLGLFKALFG